MGRSEYRPLHLLAKPVERICKGCKKKFTTDITLQKYHSKTCQRESEKARRRERRHSANERMEKAGLKCPTCGKMGSSVKNSRVAEKIGSIRRRRECLECKTRFTTYELQLETLWDVRELVTFLDSKQGDWEQRGPINKLLFETLNERDMADEKYGDMAFSEGDHNEPNNLW